MVPSGDSRTSTNAHEVHGRMGEWLAPRAVSRFGILKNDLPEPEVLPSASSVDVQILRFLPQNYCARNSGLIRSEDEVPCSRPGLLKL